MRKLLGYGAVALVAAALYAGWTMYSRWNANRTAERQAEERQRESDRRIVDALGGDALKILSFYAMPGEVRSGGRALLCYGVSNAAVVRIDPQIDGIAPSLSRCVEVFPKKTTEYKLTASGSGQSVTQSVVIRVK
jgi:hypothetical protein